MTCQFAHDDGPYVLGALSPAERQEFEQHLSACAECSRSVRELAGLPGLLARVDPHDLDFPPTDEQMPDSLLPALVREVRRTQRRRTFVTALVAAAAVVIVALGFLAATGDRISGFAPSAAPGAPSVSGAPGRTMTPVKHAPVHARVAFESVAWGTKLLLTCTYMTRQYEWPPAATYALIVRTREGQTEQVATWRSLPGKTMQLLAATATGRADIASVEVRTSAGRPVLKLTG
jgi:Putative zinc-finger